MKSYCGFGKSIFFKPPYWSFHDASCKIHDDNYEKGGERVDRMKADIGFLWRMCEDANKQETLSLKRKAVYSAIIYFLLVRFFGWISFFIIKTCYNKKMKTIIITSIVSLIVGICITVSYFAVRSALSLQSTVVQHSQAILEISNYINKSIEAQTPVK